jgi:hypothetical protein
MDRADRIDLSRLLGFNTVNDRTMGRVDFRDEMFDGKLGAKVGAGEVWAPRELLHADEDSDQGLA